MILERAEGLAIAHQTLLRFRHPSPRLQLQHPHPPVHHVDGDILVVSSGLYLCRTAGNDVLHARKTRPYWEVGRLGDAILGVYDREARRLTLEVGSGY